MRPRRHAAAALLLAALLALAGCAAISGGSQPYETPLNGSQVEQRHAQVLRDAGSFTFEVNSTSTLGNRTIAGANVTAKVDLGSDELLFATNSSVGRVEVYVPPNGTGYQRLAAGDAVRYRRLPRRPNLTQFARGGFAQVVENANFTANGTTTIDGERVWVYEARTNGSAVPAGPSALATNGTVRLYVRDDGLVKRTEIAYALGANGTTGTYRFAQTYRAVGSTAVEAPDWLDEAKNATA